MSSDGKKRIKMLNEKIRKWKRSKSWSVKTEQTVNKVFYYFKGIKQLKK